MSEATATLGGPTGTVRSERPFWKESLAPYAKPHIGRSVLDLLTSVVPYLVLFYVMYRLLDVSYLLTLAVGVLAAGFLLRTYIVFHDCTHGSFLPTKRANALLGSVVALIVYHPFAAWRHAHAVHHASAGDLDRRGVGDVPCSTVAEYRAMSPKGKLGYRLYRNPFIMFVLGPIYSTFIMQRMQTPAARKRLRRSVWATNLAVVVVVAALVWAFGWQAVLLVELPIVVLAGGAGIWLFYVQHQYPGTYWKHTDDWSFTDAALYGSSYLALPRILQFFSGNIGFHHVHHYDPKIPNYNLQRTHEQVPLFRAVPALSFADGLRAAQLKLYDEETDRMVTWKQVGSA